jgi:hypothetical protein
MTGTPSVLQSALDVEHLLDERRVEVHALLQSDCSFLDLQRTRCDE